MSKNDAQIIKDGQLAVATVAQTGELITGASVIDTTALVQTSDGPQLCVKTVDLNGGGGGGYVLPAATAETLGGVKVGEGLSVTEDGTLSAQGGGGEGFNSENLIAGIGISFTGKTEPNGIDENTIALWHFDDNYTDTITGQDPEGYYEGYYSYVTGKFGKSIAVSNSSSSYGTGIFSISSTQDFTFDYWYKFTFDGSYVLIGSVKFVRNSEYELQVYHNSDSIGTFTMTDSLNTFNHCVAQRKNQYIEVFFNGKKLAIPSTSDNWEKATPYGFSANGGDPIDELRVSKVARYNGDFTPPTIAYSTAQIVVDPTITQVNTLSSDYVIERGGTSSSWYEVWKSGWVRQGGVSGECTYDNQVTVNFPIEMRDTNYMIQQTAVGAYSNSDTLRNDRVTYVYTKSAVLYSGQNTTVRFSWLVEGYKL